MTTQETSRPGLFPAWVKKYLAAVCIIAAVCAGLAFVTGLLSANLHTDMRAIHGRLDLMNGRLDRIEGRLERVEETFEQIDYNLGVLSERLTHIDILLEKDTSR